MSDTFNSKFRAVLAELENPVKDNKAEVPTRSGRTYSYKYEDLASILDLIRSALAKHGMGQYQESYWRGAELGYVLRTHVFDDAEDKVMDERPLKFSDGDARVDAQTTGSYETYMRRYALKTVFGLAGEDDDGAATVAQNATKPQNPDTSTPQQKTPEIRDESHSEAYVQELKAAMTRISELKNEALSLGIPEDAIRAHINVIVSGKSFRDATLSELLEAQTYLENTINEARGNVDQ